MTSHDHDASLRAIQLLGRWGRISRGHVPFSGASCACSLGMGGITVMDFELHLLDYLYTKHQQSDTICALFKNSGYVEGSSGTMAALFRAVTQGNYPIDSLSPLFNDLERSIDSFSGEHPADR